VTRIAYTVEIVGHAPPFKWRVEPPAEVLQPGQSIKNLTKSGDAATYEDALFQAANAAHDIEWGRRHATTRRTEVLFEVDVDYDEELDNPLTDSA
jgi:hypothetical protein